MADNQNGQNPPKTPKNQDPYSITDHADTGDRFQFTPISLDQDIWNSMIQESERVYARITEEIVWKTSEQLMTYNRSKGELRRKLSNFVIVFLVVQFVVLSLAFLLNNILFKIDESIIKAFIVSVFVETLLGLIAMIKFSFDSKQETELIKILHSVVQNFKKLNDRNRDDGKNK